MRLIFAHGCFETSIYEIDKFNTLHNFVNRTIRVNVVSKIK
jgi:hypothetical protein